MAAAYATRTEVPVDRSQAEVRRMLTSLGAERMAMFSAPEGDSVVFEVRETYYRITAPPIAPTLTKAARAQAERSAWRALVLLIKAKKVAIEGRITTLEREFMADTVMPDGKTLVEHRDAIVSHNYREGGPPRLGFSRA